MQVLGLELDNWCQAGSQSLATGPKDPRTGVRLLVGWGAGWRGQFLTQSEMSWSLCQPTRGQGWGPAGPRVGSGLPVCRPGSQALWGCGFPGSDVCSWGMETRLDANTGFLEGRAVVWPLVDGSSWVSALWWAGPCGGAAVSSGGPCATCLLLGEALFLPCWLFGLGCTSTRAYGLLSGTRSRANEGEGGPTDAASTACGCHACVWIELPNVASLSVCVQAACPILYWRVSKTSR